MNEENNINEYVVREHLDKKLNEQTQILLDGIDLTLVKHLTETKKYLKEKLKASINAIKKV
ncbi:MAG: hypothetical protein WC678_05005 [Parcubacteria group bacterium]|jgi:hypothetical protein